MVEFETYATIILLTLSIDYTFRQICKLCKIILKLLLHRTIL